MKIAASLFLNLIALTVFSQTKIDKQGHRGCRGLMPENTIPAMKKALDLGVNTLEMDVVISKDKLPLISHEPFMSASIALKPDGTVISADEEKNFNIYKLTYAEIKKFDTGMKPNPKFPNQAKIKTYKPLLSDLIDSTEAYAKTQHYPAPHYNIETKSMPEGDLVFHPEPNEFVKIMMRVIEKKKIADRVTIQSFDPRTLELVHKNYPKYKTALLTETSENLDSDLKKLSFKPDIYSPYFKNLRIETVKACHSQSIKVIPWTVNTKDEIDHLIQLGADGIITDYPDLFDL